MLLWLVDLVTLMSSEYLRDTPSPLLFFSVQDSITDSLHLEYVTPSLVLSWILEFQVNTFVER